MFDGKVNKKSGVLVINLPSTNCSYYTTSHSGEKEHIYPENDSWMSIDERTEYERRYPYISDRIIDNLLKSEAKISVVNWDKISIDIEKLRFLIDQTYNDKANCVYDLSRPLKRRDS